MFGSGGGVGLVAHADTATTTASDSPQHTAFTFTVFSSLELKHARNMSL